MSYPPLQPYAPTPYLPPPLPPANPASTVAAAGSSSTAAPPTLLLDRELPLSPTPALRELHESLSELHAILRSLDLLEKAFVRDSLPPTIYTPICSRLLRQYHAVLSDPRVQGEFVDLSTFTRRYRIEAPAAMRRIAAGSPASLADHAPTGAEEAAAAAAAAAGGEGGQVGGGGGGGGAGGGRLDSEAAAAVAAQGAAGVNPKFAAEATQNFITFMDALRLHYRGVEELHPLLAPVVASVDKALEGTGREWEGRGTAVRWLIRLNQGKAGEEIGEEEERELLWDMERGYGSFLEVL